MVSSRPSSPFGWSPVGVGTWTGMSVQVAPTAPLARLAYLSRHSLRKLLAAPGGCPPCCRWSLRGRARPSRPRTAADVREIRPPGNFLPRRRPVLPFIVATASPCSRRGSLRSASCGWTTRPGDLPDDLGAGAAGVRHPGEFRTAPTIRGPRLPVVLLDAGAQPQPAPANQPDQKSDAGPVRRGSVTRRAR